MMAAELMKGAEHKRVMMVLVLSVISCGVLTTYTAGLLFQQKFRETGVFLALETARR